MHKIPVLSFLQSVGKPRFIAVIQILTIVSLLIFTATLLVIHTQKNIREANSRIERIRLNYTAEQRRLIKFEVDKVTKVINYELQQHMNDAEGKVKARVLEAYAIAKNIYEQNHQGKKHESIKKLIIDALRPIRYDQGRGYYFINGYDGLSRLIADTPEREGTNLLNVRDIRGRFVIQDMINIAKTKKEGFYTYYWTRPGREGSNHQKVSFVKLFEPFDWFIGTGVYLDAVESAMHKIIQHYVATHRFGPNNRGYVFINELLNINGGKKFAAVYANPNRPNDTGKLISDDYIDAKGKMFRKEFLKGIREKGECYVDYWYKKIGSPEPSPKTSYFKLAGNGRFIVAAGVYLDDVEEQITQVQAEVKEQLMRSYLVIISIFVAVITVFILFFNFLSNKLANDFSLFVNFFQKAAHSSEVIDRDKVRFDELDQLAGFANQMLKSKTATEEALRNERERLFVTLHSIVDGVIATDQNERVVMMNKVAEEMTGWQHDDAYEKQLGDILRLTYFENHHGSDTGRGENATESLRERKAILQGKFGEEFQVVTCSTPILVSGRDSLGNLVVFRDETEKIKTEEELFKARKLESIGLLAGGIAHDFNNILAGLFGNIELAKLKIKPDESAYIHIKMAHESLDRAVQLTNQLLTFAKGGEPILESVNYNSIIHHVISFNLSGSNVKAIFDIPDDLWSIHADKGQISQVLSNLTINAKHAMPDGGRLYVTAGNIKVGTEGSHEDYVKLTIGDEGGGMTSDIADKIFDPYFSTKKTGSGLGLAMVHSIIEKHGGEIKVESTPGAGTVFTLVLVADKNPGKGLTTDSSRIGRPPKKDALNILVVDDEQAVRTVLDNMLTLLGHAVEQAEEGAEGVKKYIAAMDSDQSFDLVLMDLTIPGGKGGKDAVQDILNVHPGAKVVAISGYSTDPIMAKYEDFGFCGRLSKPFNIAELQEELERISCTRQGLGTV